MSCGSTSTISEGGSQHTITSALHGGQEQEAPSCPVSPAAGAATLPAASGRPAGAGRPKSAQSALRQQFAAALQRHFTGVLRAGADMGEDSDEPSTPQIGAAAGKKGTHYRGVTKHKRTQRFEAHIWNDKKQVYLGGFDSELLAAKSHDIMALRCKGAGTDLLNFPLGDYAALAPLIEKLSRDDVVTGLRNYSKAQTVKKGCGGSIPPKGGVHKVSAPRGVPKTPRAAPAPASASMEAGAGDDAESGQPQLTIVTQRRVTRATSGQQQGENSHGGSLSPTTLQSHHPPAPFTPHSRAASLRNLPVGASRTRRRTAASRSPRAGRGGAGSPRADHHHDQQQPGSSMPRLLSGHSTNGGEGGMEEAYAAWGGAPGGGEPSADEVAEAIAVLSAAQRSGRGLCYGAAQQASLGSGPNPYAYPSPYPGSDYGQQQQGGWAGGMCAPAPRTAAAQQAQQAGDSSSLDEIDLDGVLSMLVDDSTNRSLTFSASEEGRLFEWTPVDSGHSGLEHTRTGTVLFCSPAQQAEHRRAAEEMAQETCVASTPSSLSSVMPLADPFWPTPCGPAESPPPPSTYPHPYPYPYPCPGMEYPTPAGHLPYSLYV